MIRQFHDTIRSSFITQRLFKGTWEILLHKRCVRWGGCHLTHTPLHNFYLIHHPQHQQKILNKPCVFSRGRLWFAPSGNGSISPIHLVYYMGSRDPVKKT